MLSTLHSGISKVIRSSGQALDSIGKQFELHPFTEKCETSFLRLLALFRFSHSTILLFLTLFSYFLSANQCNHPHKL